MNVVRKIYESIPGIIRIPSALKNRRVEIIMLPLDDDRLPEKPKIYRKANPIDEFIGAWDGEPLVRPEQGEFENRELLK